jgi:hypothetical protein
MLGLIGRTEPDRLRSTSESPATECFETPSPLRRSSADPSLVQDVCTCVAARPEITRAFVHAHACMHVCAHAVGTNTGRTLRAAALFERDACTSIYPVAHPTERDWMRLRACTAAAYRRHDRRHGPRLVAPSPLQSVSARCMRSHQRAGCSASTLDNVRQRPRIPSMPL